ncbi:hypothetical protein AWENTII_000180 [Aspergillus wentii]
MQKSRIIRNFDGQNRYRHRDSGFQVKLKWSSSLKIPHEDQVTKSTRSPSYLPGHGDISSTDALPSNSRHELDLDSFSEDITKQIENAFHFGDEEQVTLALPYTPKGHAQEQAADKQDNDVDRGYQKDSSFVAKFRSFTGGSAKTVSGADRRSYQTQSSTTSTGGSRSFRSDSVATQDTNLTGTSTIGTTKSALSVTTTKTNNVRPKPLVLPVVSPSYSKFIGSPHDYCFLDLDVIRSETIRPSNITGLLPRSHNARLSHPPKQPSRDKNKSDKSGPNLVVEFDKRVRHIRHITGSPSVLRTEAAVDTYARTVAVLVHYMNVVIFNARTVKLIHGLHAIGMIIEAVVP